MLYSNVDISMSVLLINAVIFYLLPLRPKVEIWRDMREEM